MRSSVGPLESAPPERQAGRIPRNGAASPTGAREAKQQAQPEPAKRSSMAPPEPAKRSSKPNRSPRSGAAWPRWIPGGQGSVPWRDPRSGPGRFCEGSARGPAGCRVPRLGVGRTRGRGQRRQPTRGGSLPRGDPSGPHRLPAGLRSDPAGPQPGPAGRPGISRRRPASSRAFLRAQGAARSGWGQERDEAGIGTGPGAGGARIGTGQEPDGPGAGRARSRTGQEPDGPGAGNGGARPRSSGTGLSSRSRTKHEPAPTLGRRHRGRPEPRPATPGSGLDRWRRRWDRVGREGLVRQSESLTLEAGTDT